MQSTPKKIRVMVVDDSIVARQIIINGLSAHPRIEVVGFAINAVDARNKVKHLQPDVMTCDVQMPGMSGIDFLKQFLPQNPLPVVLVSSLNLRVFDALDAGAVDFVRKPDGSSSTANADFITALTQKVIVAASASVRRPRIAPPTLQIPAPPLGGTTASQVIIGLGASTGGTEATLIVMKQLPEDIPGMVIVQHMSPGFTKMYAERLDRLCKMEVREAVDGDMIQRGVALVAPASFQCRVVRGVRGGYCLSIRPGEKISGHRPSVDALFSSMAETVRSPMVGIIMTGMGSDGARGMLEMRQAGAFTIGQDKESSVVYGMPAVAHEIGAVTVQAPCEHIAGILLRHLKSL